MQNYAKIMQKLCKNYANYAKNVQNYAFSKCKMNSKMHNF